MYKGIALFVFASILLGLAGRPWQQHRIDYNADIKPILNKHCMACHGGVKKEGGFSLLTREEALTPAESGKVAIVPGDPEQSELIRRLRAHDPEERMPYRKTPLTEQQIDKISRWIKEGASWELHWAYRPVQKPEPPGARTSWWNIFAREETDHWSSTGIDRYVWRRLQQEGLSPQPEAGRNSLLQRVSMDLIGIPAPENLAASFLRDSSTGAYARLVDALLASPRFGERWAPVWLDLARYADSKGYERDPGRSVWRYRDWVIRAFNADTPYDRFLTEQLAGDLLPHPTDDQYIATAFHRNTMTNDEGGTDNEEFRVAAVIDRVNTTWEALMGTTFACVQCHAHPYDPFQHKEYYGFYAFFNQTRDEDTGEDYPFLRHFSPEDSLKLLQLQTWAQAKIAPDKAAEIGLFLKTLQPAIYSIAADSFSNCELYDTKWLNMRNQASCRIKQVSLGDANRLIYSYSAGGPGGVWTVRLDSATGPVLFSSRVASSEGKRRRVAIDFARVGGVHDLYLTYQNPRLKKQEDSGLSFDWFHFTQAFPDGSADAEREFWRLLDAETPTTLVCIEAPPGMRRETHVFERGNWLVHGEQVEPCTPNNLPPMPPGAPANRLGLAQWLTAKNHPLTARTMVNRLWEQLFGLGLVETSEDFGSQGMAPTHPELLDYLAWQFMHEYNWSVKKLLKEIVLSSTYRQDAQGDAEQYEKDPRNKLLARGPRVRLSAEQIRDKTLAVAGILSPRMYGPGVMPFQPAGTWKTPWNGDDWRLSTGEDAYRRAVYTYWKRSSAYPSALTFDGAARTVCSARRIRTNTPLQALVTLNDSAFVDIAVKLAAAVEQEKPASVQHRIERLFERAIGNRPGPEKINPLIALYGQALAHFQADRQQATALLGDKQALPEQAALAVVANAVLNLDEFLTK